MKRKPIREKAWAVCMIVRDEIGGHMDHDGTLASVNALAQLDEVQL